MGAIQGQGGQFGSSPSFGGGGGYAAAMGGGGGRGGMGGGGGPGGVAAAWPPACQWAKVKASPKVAAMNRSSTSLAT